MSGDGEHWPPPLDSDDTELKKDIFAGRLQLLTQRESSQQNLAEAKAQAELDLTKQREAANQARTQSEAQAELDLNTEFHKAILAVAQGTLDRAQNGAETVQKAAAAVLTIYTAVLGVTFSVSNHPLPARGLTAAALLGFSIVFSTGYLAFLRGTRSATAAPEAKASARAAELARDRFFIEWTRTASLTRSYWLRASVLCLGFAVMFLPAPFIAVGQVKVDGHVLFGKTQPPPAATKLPRWPRTPSETSTPSLQRILYKAQVAEVATARTETAKPVARPAKAGDDGVWAILAIVALAASLFTAWLFGLGADKKDKHTAPETATPPGPDA
jgi:hypothetical protein